MSESGLEVEDGITSLRNHSWKAYPFRVLFALSFPMVVLIIILVSAPPVFLIGALAVGIIGFILFQRLPHEPMEIRFESGSISATYSAIGKVTKTVHYGDVAGLAWSRSVTGSFESILLKDGDVVVLQDVTAEILAETVRRLKLARPDLNWGQIDGEPISAAHGTVTDAGHREIELQADWHPTFEHEEFNWGYRPKHSR